MGIMSNIKWEINDEKLFNSKLKKLGLVRFIIEVEKAIWKQDLSEYNYRYLSGVLERLYEMRNVLLEKENNKKRYYQKNMFAKR